MATADTGWFRCENGQVLEMDLPLPDAFHARLNRGEIVRVANAAGDPWHEDGPPAPATGSGSSDTEAALRAERDTLAGDLKDAQDELELATKQRDALAAELAEAREQLAAVTAERDQLAAPDVTTKPASEAPAKAAKSSK